MTPRRTIAVATKIDTDAQRRQQTAIITGSSETNEWYTPGWIVELAREAMGSIDLDPASNHIAQAIVNATEWFGLDHHDPERRDGSTAQWHGNVFLNPPFGKVKNKSSAGLWAEHLIAEYQAGRVISGILLVKAAFGYPWFQELWHHWPTCLLDKRFSFIQSDGTERKPATYAVALIYFGRDVERFRSTFRQFGRVVLPEAEELVSARRDAQIADYLASFWPELPAKHIRMNASGPRKYSWVKDGDRFVPLTYTDLLAHARGEKLIGAYLHDAHEMCRVGALDIDEGGQDALRAALSASERLGQTAYAIYIPGQEHDGGRLVVPFSTFVPYCDIRAVMEQIRDAAGLPKDTEIWPGNNNGLGLPFGYHIRKRTRGTLISPLGETFHLDNPAQRAEALATVKMLQSNEAPPPAPMVPTGAKPVHTSDNSHYLNSAERRISPGEAVAEDMSFQERLRLAGSSIRDQYDLVTELEHAGAVKTRDGYSCPFCEHSHKTTLTIEPGGKVGCSHSPQCKLAGSKGFDVTNVLMLTERCSGFVQLARKLAPHLFPKPRPAAPQHEQPEYLLSPEERAQRDARNAQRRADRRADNRQALTTLYDYVSTIALPDRALLLFAYLHQLADNCGLLQVRPTNEQIIEATGMLERTVQRAFGDLAAAQIGVRRGGRGGLDRPNEAAVWTFNRFVPVHRVTAKSTSVTLVESRDLDLDPDQESYERAAATPEPASDYDLWEWTEPEHGADELNFVPAWGEVAPEPAPRRSQAVTAKPPVIVSVGRPDARNMCLVRWSDGSAIWQRSTEGSNAPLVATLPAADYSRRGRGGAGGATPVQPAAAPAPACPARVGGASGTLEPEATPESDEWAEAEAYATRALAKMDERARTPRITADGDRWYKLAVAYERGSASYDPALDWTANASRTHFAPPAEHEKPADLRAIGSLSGTWHQSIPDTLVEPQREQENPDPLVRCPPTDPKLSSRYYGLRGKARKATSEAQRYALNRQADALMEWLPVSEGGQGGRTARRSQATLVQGRQLELIEAGPGP